MEAINKNPVNMAFAPGGADFLFADGSVHFLPEDIDMLTYQRLSIIAGGEVVEIPEE